MTPQSSRRISASRRRLLGTAVFGSTGLLVANLAGCGSSKKPAPASSVAAGTDSAHATTATVAASQPKRGGTIRDGRLSIIQGTTFDPHTGTPNTAQPLRVIYQGLLGANHYTLELEPELATKWEQPSQTEYIMSLAPNVHWHNKPPANGRALTVDDVVYSLNRVRTNDPKFFYRSLLDGIDRVEAVGANQVRITTKQPDAVFLFKLSGDGPQVLAPEVVEKAGKFATADTAVGTGGFVLDSYQEGVSLKAVRNAAYWKTGLPYLDEYDLLSFSDDQAGYSAYLASQLDIANVPGTEVSKYVSSQGAGYQPQWAKDRFASSQWMWTNTKVKPLDDPRVTRALRLLLDHQELEKANGEAYFGRAINGFVLPAVLDSWDYTADEYGKLPYWQQQKDAAAKQALDLLAAAGFTKDNPLKFDTIAQVNVRGNWQEGGAVLVQAEWKRLSQGVVDTNLKILDRTQSSDARGGHNFTVGVISTAGAVDDPDSWFSLIFRTNASRNYGSFSDSEIDGLIDKQRGTFDLEQRKSVVKDVIRLLIDRGTQTMLYRNFFLNGTNKVMRGWLPEGQVPVGRQYEHVWLAR